MSIEDGTYTDYEKLDKCLDCSNTRDCPTEGIKHHKTAEDGGHYAVIYCPNFHDIEEK